MWSSSNFMDFHEHSGLEERDMGVDRTVSAQSRHESPLLPIPSKTYMQSIGDSCAVGATASVKNTFVHFTTADEQGQPDLNQKSKSGPASMSEPALLNYCHESEEEDTAEDEQPEPWRSASGPGRLAASAREHLSNDEQPTLERRCTSDLAGQHEAVKVALPLCVSVDTTTQVQQSNCTRDLSPFSRWLGFPRPDPAIDDPFCLDATGTCQLSADESLSSPVSPSSDCPLPQQQGTFIPSHVVYAAAPICVTPLAGWFASASMGTLRSYDLAAASSCNAASWVTAFSFPPGLPATAPPEFPETPPPQLSENFDEVQEEETVPHWVRVPLVENLPSIGSAGHHAGNCRPCAHHWRVGGCSKGKACAFCHACGEGAFCKDKRVKVMKLRGEGVPRRRAERSKAEKSAVGANAATAKQDVSLPDVRWGGRADYTCVSDSAQTWPSTWYPASLTHSLLQPGSCSADAANIMLNPNHWDMVAANSQQCLQGHQAAF